MSFVANGLLGPLQSTPPSLEETPYFALNGLLGVASSKPEFLGDDSFNDGTQQLGDVLSALSSEGTRVSPPQPSQDDDLPDVSVLLDLCKTTAASTVGNRHRIAFETLPNEHGKPIRATTFDGKSLHLKRRARKNNLSWKARDSSSQRIGNILDVPIHRLMERLSAKTAAQLDLVPPLEKSRSHHVNADDTLWVDRYRPACFADLLGNDRVSREIMAWVKQWDWCVFGKNKSRKRPRVDDENQDEYHRPLQKILLLTGPPGLGKTTLAHVVARQAGYEVMEINASDARSAQVVDERIRPALESGTAVGGSKPVLVVIDEIDGATGGGENSTGFIQKLVGLTYDTPKRNHRTTQARDIQRKRPLLRPIICICNDHNTAALAKLRPHANILRFTRPSDIHTVRRLQQICGFEGLKADTRALTTLVGVAKGDLRGCLNTLQFIKAKNEDVTENVVRDATVGMKEADTTVHSALNGLFAPLTRKRAKELGLSELDETKYVGRLCQEVEATGKISTIATGCFTHYATLRHHDVNFSRYEKAAEWLGVFDTFNSTMYSDGDFDLSPYLPFLLVPFFPLFQERGASAIERNHTDWDHLQLVKSNEEIYESLSRAAHARHGGSFRHLATRPTLQLEFVPYINRIISPPLRPVNSQIIRPDERAILSRLVDIMASLELRFVKDKTEDGQLFYGLDPPIDVFVTYDGKRASDIPVSRYAVRHLVAAEVDALILSRHAETKDLGSSRKRPRTNVIQNEDADADMVGETNVAKKKVDIADKPPTDFFGRPITDLSTKRNAGTLKKVEKKFRVTYRFLEGNSAAVRKSVKVGAFV